MNNLVLEIMKLALEINTEEKNTIICNFNGHCLGFECSLYENGWKEYTNPDFRKIVFFDMEGTSEKLNEILRYLKILKN